MLGSNSTRHLAAGTYLDADFRNAVLHELLGRRDQAVAPAFSTDAVPVVRHALNARRHQLVRDAVLTGILLLFLVVEGRVLLAVLLLAGAFLLVMRALRALVRLRVGTALALLIPIVILLIAAAALADSGSNLISLSGSSDPYETQRSFGSLAVEVLGVLVVLLGAAWTTVVVQRLIGRQTILDRLMPETFDPAESPTGPKGRQARIRYIAAAQTGNVTYYPQDGTGQPFVGAGTPQHTWTRTVPLVLTSTGGSALTTESLRDALSVGLARLNDEVLQSDEVSVQDRLVTPAVGGDPWADSVTGLLRHRLPPEELDRLTQVETTGTYRYLSVRTAPGRGDYEIWVFVRCLVHGQTLHLDLIECCLPPVRALYRDIDQYPSSGRGVVLRTALGTLPELPGLLLRAPLRLAMAAVGRDRSPDDLRDWLRQFGASGSSGRGARASVRELGTDQDSGNLLTGLAMQRPIRVIEQRVLEIIAAELDQSGYDAEEFRRRTQAVLDGPAQ